MITYHRIKDYNNLRTQNIILYIIYNIIIRVIIKIIIPDQGFNKIIESLNQIYNNHRIQGNHFIIIIEFYHNPRLSIKYLI